MADDAMNPPNPTKLMMMPEAGALMRAAMTPIERTVGRFLRAPDHPPAGDGGEAAPAAGGEAPPAAAGDPPAGDGLDDSTILGGGEKPADESGDDKSGDPPADAPKDDAPQGAPEKYELALPEGVTLDEASMAVAEPVFRELGLNNDQASKLAAMAPQLFEARDKAVQERATQGIIGEVVAQRKAWATETQNDAEFGGANFEANKVHAARFIDSFGRKDAEGNNILRKVMDETGLGNHPALFAAFAKAGADLAEDTPPPSAGGAAEKPKTVGEVFYKRPNTTVA